VYLVCEIFIIIEKIKLTFSEDLIMSKTNQNPLLRYLSSPMQLSPENIQDFQAAFSIIDTQSKGYVASDDINRVAQAAGIFNRMK
jgi:Ca2+-binding EF-hand superfamily protein